MKKLLKLQGLKLIAFCMAVIICLWFAKCLFFFGAEKVAASTGNMKTIVLSADDFELIGINKLDDGVYISTDHDCQMLYNCDTMVSRITINSNFAVDPGEVIVYYTQKEGQGFHPDKRYWFYPDNEGIYTANIPLRKIFGVRIDPTIMAANTMTIDSIVFNAPKSFGQFFAVNGADIFRLFLYSTLVSAVITLLREFFDGFSIKKFIKRG